MTSHDLTSQDLHEDLFGEIGEGTIVRMRNESDLDLGSYSADS